MKLKEYLKMVDVEIDTTTIKEWDDLSLALHLATDGNLWAYPLEENGYCEEENHKVVEVELPSGEVCLAEVWDE